MLQAAPPCDQQDKVSSVKFSWLSKRALSAVLFDVYIQFVEVVLLLLPDYYLSDTKHLFQI